MKSEGFMELQLKLLTKEEIKNLLLQKGWTNRSLAEWWGCSEEYVSKILNNEVRRRWFDDAIRGLPRIRKGSK